MISVSQPYYTYNFGKMGRTQETARQSAFFDWFHLVQTEQNPCEPGLVTRFRPEGESFRSRCWLDVLEASGGGMVQMELVLSREFIDGRDGLFAQDLVKSFLLTVLSDACRDLLADVMQEFTTPGMRGATPGFLVFVGRRDEWATQTGWSRLALSNVSLKEERVFVVRVCPNPAAPNATRVGGKSGSRLRRMLAMLGL